MNSKTSYKIKHDYLFEDEDTIIEIPLLDKNIEDYDKLLISEIMKASKESGFAKIIRNKTHNIILIDDIGKCINPQSESYKSFIIRCTYRKLVKLGFSVYI